MRLLLPAILFGVSLTLGGAIAYEAIAPLDPVTVETPRPPPRRAASPPAPAYAPPAEALFADIDARPLFSAQRKPLQDMMQMNGAAAAASDFVLVGVIMGGTRAVALLRSKSTSDTLSAAAGDMVNGWRVARIDATTVTLHSAGGDVVVPLDGPANRPPSAPLQPVPAPQPTPRPAPAATNGPAPASQPGQSIAASGTAKPVPAVHDPTIAPEALRGAPIDPSTGQPTL